MRIITGKAKGCSLLTLEGMTTRPTAERTKEAVFSTLQFSIEGRNVLDLFAGSGQLGLEALSRGAKHAFLVDKDKSAVEIIKKNAEKTKLKDNSTIVNTDFETFLDSYKDREKFDIIFLDPPYKTDFIDRAVEMILKNGMCKPTTYFVIESDRDGVISNFERFEIIKSAKYGIAHVIIFKLKEE